VDSVIAASFDERGEPQIHAAAKIGWSTCSPALPRQRAKSRLNARRERRSETLSRGVVARRSRPLRDLAQSTYDAAK